MSQIFTHPSKPPERIILQSHENVTEYTELVCPYKEAYSFNVDKSHIFIILSQLPLASNLLSLDVASVFIVSVCPVSAAIY